MSNISRNLEADFCTSTAERMKYSIKSVFGKCDQFNRKLRIWSHLLMKILVENFIFCAVLHP